MFCFVYLECNELKRVFNECTLSKWINIGIALEMIACYEANTFFGSLQANNLVYETIFISMVADLSRFIKILCLLLLLAGDIEENPGPTSKLF